MTNNSIKLQLFVYTQLKDQTVLFQTIQFSIKSIKLNGSKYCYLSLTIQLNIYHLFAFSLNIKKFYLAHIRTLSGATTPDRSGSGYNVNEGVPHIPHSFKTGASPSDCFVTYPGHSLMGFYTSAEMQSLYSVPPSQLALCNTVAVIVTYSIIWFS